jgi:hypothetical protein
MTEPTMQEYAIGGSLVHLLTDAVFEWNKQLERIATALERIAIELEERGAGQR